MDFPVKKGAGNKTILRWLNPFSFNHFQKGRTRKSVLAPLPFGECQKNVPFPENRTLSCQKIVLSRKSYFPENRTFQKIVPVFHFFRKMYLFSENRTIALYPLSHNGFGRFDFQKFVLIFTFLEIICINIYNVFIFYLYLYRKQKMVGSSKWLGYKTFILIIGVRVPYRLQNNNNKLNNLNHYNNGKDE